MNAVVALLDEQHNELVEALWEELEHDFGVRDTRHRVPWPHTSLHGAETYAIAEVDARLRELAGRIAPFVVHADGLGIFAGPLPVLYVRVQRNNALNALHDAVWEAVGAHAKTLSPYYAPDRWAAHITLAQLDITPQTLGPVVTRLAARTIDWRITLPGLALILGEGEGLGATYRLHARYAFAGG